ncbi:DEAD/DEAH box helicase [Alkalihalobacillus sp. 1P02AB]|uniref:DEAD/DEAH box helicase n=1 Tax=Alkalihalobacillus sp. 1P02AB TaxID=3132260 RepID=UPI0039A4FEB7
MENNNFRRFLLSEPILKALELMKLQQPTEVQHKVIPKALNGEDLIVQSQTGSGKTLAFALPVTDKVDWAENKPQALILTPTRELAVQVRDEVTNIGRLKRINSVAVFGKDSYLKQKNLLKQKTHIVVGTPGRVLDHIQKGTLLVEDIKHLIIDEADQMLSMGFIDEMEAIIESLPTQRQTMVFSATYPDDIQQLCSTYMVEPEVIEIQATGVTATKIDHFKLCVHEKEKCSVLKDLLVTENPNSCIIFCNTQIEVDKLYRILNQSLKSLGRLHGGMAQRDRFLMMDRFRSGQCRYLVATGVAGRGIDVEKVSMVINYEVPMEAENYVHRTGRTGRAGERGKAFTFVSDSERNDLEAIEQFIGFIIEEIPVPSQKNVQKNLPNFQQKMNATITPKVEKADHLQAEVTKLYFNGGKKKKLRAVDFVGTISKIAGINADDIGVISILDQMTYIDILNGKGPLVLQAMRETTVKGKQLKVHIARK